MALRLLTTFTLVLGFCGPFSLADLPPQCRELVQQLTKTPDVATLEKAFREIISPELLKRLNLDQHLREKINALVSHLKDEKTPQKEVIRLLGTLISKLVIAAQNKPDANEISHKAVDLLYGLNSAQEISLLLAAIRGHGDEERKLFNRIASQAEARLSHRSHAEQAREVARIAYLMEKLKFPPAVWISGAKMGLPEVPPFDPIEFGKYMLHDPKGVEFEVQALRWIHERGEHFYAIGEKQVLALYSTPQNMNADALTVQFDENGKPLINIREFKNSQWEARKAALQIFTTLKELLEKNPDAAIGQLEVLIPEHITTAPPYSFSINGKAYSVVYRRI